MSNKREGFNHRTAIKWLIIPVMVITVGYSIFNVSEYASQYHHGAAVWLLGCSVGLANAISVYSLVIAETPSVRWAAVAGISLFGLLSAILQVSLYLQSGAFWPVALALGAFGPLAEGLLSWQHATLSDEQAKVQGRKPQSATQKTQKIAPAAGTQPATQPATAATQPAVTERARIAAELAAQEIPQREIADKLGVSVRTVQLDLKAVREASLSTNGKEHI